MELLNTLELQRLLLQEEVVFESPSFTENDAVYLNTIDLNFPNGNEWLTNRYGTN